MQYQVFEYAKVNNHVVDINYIRSSSGTTCELLVPIDSVLACACAYLWSIIIKLRFDFFGVLVYMYGLKVARYQFLLINKSIIFRQLKI